MVYVDPSWIYVMTSILAVAVMPNLARDLLASR